MLLRAASATNVRNKECYKKYSATVGTIFQDSNIKLSVWFTAMHIITAHKKGISSCQLARDLEVTQKNSVVYAA